MKSIASALFTICVLFTFSVSAQTQPQSPSNPPQKPLVEYLNPGGGQNYPFSDAVRVGDWLILSGRIGPTVPASSFPAASRQKQNRRWKRSAQC